MPRFSEQTIQEIVDKNNIVDVISSYVILKKKGSSYMGLCPFHNEKTPSFSVSEQKGIYHCFGCGEGGDVIHFIMKVENLTFFEAVKFLANRANITLPAFESSDFQNDKAKKEEREVLFNINRDAAAFFYDKLKTPQGKPGIDYFKQRKLNKECVTNYRLGYAPNSFDELSNYLVRKGYSKEDIAKSGLQSANDNGKTYDKFRNRVMFPIFNVNNNVIGFGGRVLSDDKPKYLNSPETLVFNKSRNLYSLNLAKASGKKNVILVEGYMDVISVAKAGILNVVATLGTALTSEQCKLLKRYFEEVLICYDSDEAGQTATKRAISVLRDFDIKIYVVNLLGKKDPDEFINEYGKDRFIRALKERKTDIEYLINIYAQKYDLSKNDDKISYVNDLVPYLKKIRDSVELEVYTGIIAKKISVSKESINMQVNKNKAQSVSTVKSDTKTSFDANFSYKTDKISLITEKLINLIVFNKRVYLENKSVLSDDMFLGEYKDFYLYVKNLYDEDKDFDINSMLESFDQQKQSVLSRILIADGSYTDSNKAFSDFVKIIKDELKKINVYRSLNVNDQVTLNKLLKTNDK